MLNLIPLCRAGEPYQVTDRHLVLCPFAGGSASAFRSWRDLQPAGWQIWLAVYPGRDQRMNEPLATRIGDLAYQVLAAIDSQKIVYPQLVLAGHSMGAQVAYEVCAQLERQGSLPSALILSGCHAPHLKGRRLLSHLDDGSFLEQLADIGGNADALLSEPDLWPVFLPMLRADFRATESYERPLAEASIDRLKTPSLLIYGSSDHEAWQTEVDAWKMWLQFAEGPLAISGDHFYVTRRPRAFLEHIQRWSESLLGKDLCTLNS